MRDGCEVCEDGKILFERKRPNNWVMDSEPGSLPFELGVIGYTEIIFLDRGYLRIADKDDCGCMDHGDKIKANFCLECGKDLRE